MGMVFTQMMARNLHTRLADQIGLRIVGGEITPGDPLPSELRICDMMGVSRTAVREAIRVLVGKGLLESKPKSGTRVREPENWNHLDPDVLRWRLEVTEVDSYLQKLFQLRFAVEPTASALAASVAGPADVERIREAFDRMRSAATEEAFVDADLDFHRSIYVATHNEFFWPVAQMFALALRASFRIGAKGGHRKRAIEEHGALMEAIAGGEPENAHGAALKLLGNAANDLVQLVGHDPFRTAATARGPALAPRRPAGASRSRPKRRGQTLAIMYDQFGCKTP
jgi:DNA-binding FadR family transcriptional regulator